MAAPNLVYAEVLTCGEDALQPSLLLSIERRATYSTETTVLRRYLFDAPEEIVRFCGSHGLKLGKFAAVFITSGQGGAGLPELILAAAEQGLPRLHVRGPGGVVSYTRVITETLGNPRAMNVLPADVSTGREALCYEDEHLQVFAVAVVTAEPGGLDSAADNHQRPKKRLRGSAPGVGYRCHLRHGGADLLVLPGGASPAAQHGAKACDVAVHLGDRPSGAGEREFGATTDGRRRGLWKARERLGRWRSLCPSLAPPPVVAPSGSPSTDAAPGGSPAIAAEELPGQLAEEAGEKQGIVAEGAAGKRKPALSESVSNPVLRAYLWPVLCFDPGDDEENNEAAVQRETIAECEEWGLSDAVAKASEVLLRVNAAEAGETDPELLFLGTGSAKPTSRRGQSAILLGLGGFTALLDCGGGTWAQLVRLLGAREAQEVLDKLDLIWVSHHHADHCAGLPTLLMMRTAPGLRVVASSQVLRFWRAAAALAGGRGGSALAAPAMADHRSFRPPAAPGWPSLVQSVPVTHCPQSYALVLRSTSVQVVYSGDCRPSEELVQAALAGASTGLRTWLVHEATFNPDEEANAIAVRHSTTQEALDVARRMRATGVLLTHFSQRYPGIAVAGACAEGGAAQEDRKIAPVEREASGGSGEVKEAADADGLRIRAQEMTAFGAARLTFEEYWARRHEKNEKDRRSKLPQSRQPPPGSQIPRSCFQPLVAGGGGARLQARLLPSAAPAPAKAESTREEAAKSPRADVSEVESGQMEVESAPAEKEVAAQACVAPGAGLETRLRAFYLRFNPEKVDDAANLARLFAGKEALLNVKLRARYSEDLQSQDLGPTPAAAASSSSDSEDGRSGDAKAAGRRPRRPTRLLAEAGP
eukprot:CAMPEP_0175443002 /NCGR_PEP_ID=MMETSP0095-20121207/58448_1 /TAXON_ID=311494 /ORGANISM="Alexandrium monilatum, Strain CCMP3105" /LENGTH=872 /DNA_ID=CAMNT_0016743067 /DNA_START=66 /DNA_END=2680 /DNA_ORIENTATION=-